ncbi:lysophospholipid acyltransferase family protein [Alloacidobacterium sp.]|uniref:lysophospholipid acyltransferase family protein n=1 Tax=Alloacidobacterium sp. TaxID=2951999 RepID=UPI002D47DCD3|nr:lysophospholipid acyltransferase family protein [Alloacidobacterium sp.]HYK36379.1 lysophospholipid acyltransferase family protein [Alloacidobacterium sp.]
MQENLEFAVVWMLVRLLGLLPRSIARPVGAAIGWLAFRIVPRLRSVGLRNLTLAFPEWPDRQRRETLRLLYRNLGWLMAEFCQMPKYTRENSRAFLRYEGLEHYLDARAKGKGVLIVTGHLGAWELSSFYHSLMGYPMSMVIRRLDNARVDNLVNHIRCLHGNRVLHKDDFARGLLGAMRAGETVGILMDTNMTPPQGVFVPYFGKVACTASGLARVALKTGATVLPGFMLWEKAEQKYVLHFGEEIVLDRTGNNEADAVTNTAKCTAAIEAYVRRYPDQWLWVHRRWKTCPEGEGPVY